MIGRRAISSVKPPAIVVGLDSITGLQTARILAARGVPIVGVARDRDHPFCRTRVCQKIVYANTATEELIEALEHIGPTLADRSVLVPCTDPAVRQISRLRGRVSPWYHVVLPEAELLDLLIDKMRFYEYASSKGLPIPQTFVLRSREDAEKAAGELDYPCILKPPLKSDAWDENMHDKALKISGVEEFLTTYEKAARWASPLLAQQWIPGDDIQLFSCNCYLDASSTTLVTFVARKLRQWPPQTGTSCLGEECRNDVVLRETVRLFEDAGFHGLGYLELKQHAETGAHYIVEPNVGRPTVRSAIAEAGGVELLYTMYCDTVGFPLPENREQQYRGAKWIYLRNDVRSALHYRRNGELTTREWLRSWRGCRRDALFSLRDPRPFFADVWYGLNVVRNRRSEPKTVEAAAP
jgi:predicted ATP-grasp superfamily ATP-dependent carboligase